MSSEQGHAPTAEELTRVLALDGPAGSGKSSVARLAAEALGWRFVDTGATYRAATLKALRAGVDLHEADAVAAVVSQADIALDVDPRAPRALLDGEDVSSEIRGPEVTAAVSTVSAVPAVRAQLVILQRRLMGTAGAVVEGRDIARVVAPHAVAKVYLDARPEVRAGRRAAQEPTSVSSTAASDSSSPENDVAVLEAVQAALQHRDAQDNQTNKLEVSYGAVHLDTSDLTLDQVVAAVVQLVQTALLQAGLPDHGDSAGSTGPQGRTRVHEATSGGTA